MDGTVLVADDDRTIRTVLTQALTRAGCKVHATSSLTTLMRWVAEGKGDVVITDVTAGEGVLAVMGPNSRKLLEAVSPNNFNNDVNPFGTAQEIEKKWQFESITNVEGHQSTNCAAASKAYTYDARGFLESKTDWLGNVTTYVRDTRGLVTLMTEAAGSNVERTISYTYDPVYRLPETITETKIVSVPASMPSYPAPQYAPSAPAPAPLIIKGCSG